MSEGKNDNLLRPIKNLIRKGTELKSEIVGEIKSENIARKAVEQLSQFDHNPIKTYKAGDESVLDLKKLNPGSILRFTDQPKHKEIGPFYTWFVLGLTPNENPDLFIVYNPEVISTQPKLLLEDDWHLSKYTATKQHSFTVKEASKALYGLEENPLGSITQIDLMSWGTKEKQKEKSKQGNKNLVLRTAPSSI